MMGNHLVLFIELDCSPIEAGGWMVPSGWLGGWVINVCWWNCADTALLVSLGGDELASWQHELFIMRRCLR